MKDTREVFSVLEAAKFLGCSKSHMWRIISWGELKYTNIAEPNRLRQIRILKEDLIQWLKAKQSRGNIFYGDESKD